MSHTSSPVKQRLPRAEREQQILDAAEREFERHGFAGASMEVIAQASGITKALVYQYFESKEGVYSACVERGRARLFERLESAAADADPREMLTALVSSYFDQLDADRNSAYVLYGDAPPRAVDEMRRRNAEVVARLLREGSSLPEHQVELVAQLIVGAGEQVGRWWLEHRDIAAAEVKAGFTTALAGAISALVRG